MIRGKNAYYCKECGGYTITVDVDEGVTPMFLACRAEHEGAICKGRATSMMYPAEPWPEVDAHDRLIPTEPKWEWYKPSLKWARRQGPEMLDHVKRGGLSIRRIES